MSKLEQISTLITDYFGTSIASVKSRTRISNVAKARHLICYFAKTDLRLTYLEIGDWLGRDHTTIINSCSNIRDSLATEAYLFQDYNNLREDVYKIAYKGHVSLLVKAEVGVNVDSIVSEIRQTYPHVTFLIA